MEAYVVGTVSHSVTLEIKRSLIQLHFAVLAYHRSTFEERQFRLILGFLANTQKHGRNSFLCSVTLRDKEELDTVALTEAQLKRDSFCLILGFLANTEAYIAEEKLGTVSCVVSLSEMKRSLVQ